MTASQIESISKIVFEDKQELNCSILAKTLGIHIDEAKEALNKFANTNESKVIVEYMVSSEGNGETANRMVIVSQDELESTKSIYKNAIIHPYSVRASDAEVASVLNFEKFLLDGDDFESVQKCGHIRNEQIKCRPNRRTVMSKSTPTIMEPVKLKSQSIPIKEEKKSEKKFFKKEPETETTEEKHDNTLKKESDAKMEALKEVSSNVSFPRKRVSNNTGNSDDDEIDGDVIKKKRKRVIIEDSDEESTDGLKDGEFMVTKLKEEPKDETKEKKAEKTPPTKKPEPAKAKGKPVKGQTSIMNFFKKN